MEEIELANSSECLVHYLLGAYLGVSLMFKLGIFDAIEYAVVLTLMLGLEK